MVDKPGPVLTLGSILTNDMLAGQRKLREAMVEIGSVARTLPTLLRRVHDLEEANAALASALAPYAQDGEEIDASWDGERRRATLNGGAHIKVRHARAAARAMALYRATKQTAEG